MGTAARSWTVALALIISLAQQGVSSAGQTCNGKPVTVSGITGTSGDDVIKTEDGDAADGVPVRGFGGDDTICVGKPRSSIYDVYAGSGNDHVELITNAYVSGNDGNDHIIVRFGPQFFAEIDGGPGNDLIRGGTTKASVTMVFRRAGRVAVNFRKGTAVTTLQGTDSFSDVRIVTGSAGDDVFRGRRGRQLIQGASGSDRFYLGGGRDTADAGGGDDRIHTGPGKDYVIDGSGTDRAYAGPGRDKIFLSPGTDLLEGNAGLDRLFAEPTSASHPDWKEQILLGVVIDLARGFARTDRWDTTIDGIEDVDTADGDDIVRGNARRNRVFTEAGNDKLKGRGGPDHLDAGDYSHEQSERIDGGSGHDRCEGAEVMLRCEEEH